MKIIAWNINGIKSILKKEDLINLINTEDPDIFCLGEIKISCPFIETKEELNNKLKEKYYNYWSPCKTRNGYSGTAIFSKKEPIDIVYGLNINNTEYDEEGRVITCEFKKFYLIHVYTPNSGEGLKRLDFRVNTWDKMFIKYINKLQEKKPIILCGDLNVAHKEIDIKNSKTNLKTAGFTLEERDSFDILLTKLNIIDTFRYLKPSEIKYSYWSYRFNSREKNIGWRIDYFLVSEKILKKVENSDILTDIYGSDHAPIKLEIKV
jgi:exodeoxyribonuclease-3